MKKAIILTVSIIILILCIGLVAFFLLKAEKNNTKNSDTQLEEMNSSVQMPTLPEDETFSKNSYKITKKYTAPKEGELVYTYLKAEIISENPYEDTYEYDIPQINIKSTNTDKINEEILNMFEEIINAVTKGYLDEFDEFGYAYGGLSYEYCEIDNILSLSLHLPSLITGYDMKIYNIDITTGEEVKNSEIIKKLGLTVREFKDKLSDSILNGQKDVFTNDEAYKNMIDNKYYEEKASTIARVEWCRDVDTHKLFVGKNKHIYIYLSTLNLLGAGGEGAIYTLDLEDMKFRKWDSEPIVEQEEKTDIDNSVSEYTSRLTDAQNGKLAFEELLKQNELQTEKHESYYTYVDPFNNRYDIKEIKNIESEEGIMGVDNWAALFNVKVMYLDNNNDTKVMELAIILLPNHEIQIGGTYLNYTGTTSFVRAFTNLY